MPALLITAPMWVNKVNLFLPVKLKKWSVPNTVLSCASPLNSKSFMRSTGTNRAEPGPLFRTTRSTTGWSDGAVSLLTESCGASVSTNFDYQITDYQRTWAEGQSWQNLHFSATIAPSCSLWCHPFPHPLCPYCLQCFSGDLDVLGSFRLCIHVELFVRCHAHPYWIPFRDCAYKYINSSQLWDTWHQILPLFCAV